MPARHGRPQLPFPAGWQLVTAEGAGPFVSRIVHRLPDGSLHIWTSRRHRKGHGWQGTERVAAAGPDRTRSVWFTVWAPAQLGWWIAVLFMVGSACFALASFAGLAPDTFDNLLQNATVINAVFFAGSIFFTAAGYLQLLEAINADRRAAHALGIPPREKFRWLNWQPGHIGWLSAFIQFIGTLLFNVNTFDALLPGLDWLQQDLFIWTPDIIGSICFLVASWLALLEFCHGYWCRQPHSLSWWIVIVNLLGSLAFMVSAIFAVALPGAASLFDLRIVNLSTCIGGVCFLCGAYLLLPEMADHTDLAAKEESLAKPPAQQG
jgi:hypothetical protein